MGADSAAFGSKGEGSVRKQIRGSSLLLLGRVCSVGVGLVAQLVLVRYLSTSGFGAFAYALSVVDFCQSSATLGMKSALARFVPVFHERGEYEKLRGTIFLSLALILGLSLVVVLLFTIFAAGPGRFFVPESQSVELLEILIFLVPLQGLDWISLTLFACFGKPRAIFFRKYLLSPGLKLAVVLLLVWSGRGTRELAFGYVTGGILAVLLSLWLLGRIFRREGILNHRNWRQLQVPGKEVAQFALPMLASDLVPLAVYSLNILLLGYFHPPTEVAFYSVAYTLAGLNWLVMSTSSVLYTPSVARLSARQEMEAVGRLYRQTALWTAAVSFPIVALTFGAAETLLQLLYGSRYLPAAPVLALISLGYFCSLGFGYNDHTLRALGRGRQMVRIDGVTMIFNLGLNLWWIPAFGAVGAAAAVAVTLILQNGLRLLALRRVLPWSRIRAQSFPFYRVIAAGFLSLLLLRLVAAGHPGILFAAAGAVAFLVFLKIRRHLQVGEIFPELEGSPGPIGLFLSLMSFAFRRGLLLMLDLAAASRLRHCSPAGGIRNLWSRRSRRQDRFLTGIRLLDRLIPGLIPVLIRWVNVPSRLPLPSGPVYLLDRGRGDTVFLCCPGGVRQVLKVHRETLGQDLSGMLAALRERKEPYDALRGYYNTHFPFLPRAHFLVLHGPLLGSPVGAALQPFIPGRKIDLLRDLSRREWTALMRRDLNLRRQFIDFAEKTISLFDAGGYCLDLLGRQNVLLVTRGKRRRIVAVDTGIIDLRRLRRDEPWKLQAYQQSIRRIEALLQEVESGCPRSGRAGEAPAAAPGEGMGSQPGERDAGCG